MVLFGDSSPKARTLNRQLLVDPNAHGCVGVAL
jgi:hypothetical protein